MLKPKGDRVIMKKDPDKEDAMLSSGIVVPKAITTEKVINGEIASVSDTVTSVSIGDRVLVSMFAGTEVEQEDGKYLILKEHELLAIVE